MRVLTEGVYVLSRAGKPVYVGTSEVCEVRVKQHGNKEFDAFWIGEFRSDERLDVERELIERLKPQYNQPSDSVSYFDQPGSLPQYVDFDTVKEVAEKWRITTRMVRNHARDGRITGAVLVNTWNGRIWLIPKGAKKPERKA